MGRASGSPSLQLCETRHTHTPLRPEAHERRAGRGAPIGPRVEYDAGATTARTDDESANVPSCPAARGAAVASTHASGERQRAALQACGGPAPCRRHPRRTRSRDIARVYARRWRRLRGMPRGRRSLAAEQRLYIRASGRRRATPPPCSSPARSASSSSRQQAPSVVGTATKPQAGGRPASGRARAARRAPFIVRGVSELAQLWSRGLCMHHCMHALEQLRGAQLVERQRRTRPTTV